MWQLDSDALSLQAPGIPQGSIPTADVLKTICLTCASASKHATWCILKIHLSSSCGESAQVLEKFFIKKFLAEAGP